MCKKISAASYFLLPVLYFMVLWHPVMYWHHRDSSLWKVQLVPYRIEVCIQPFASLVDICVTTSSVDCSCPFFQGLLLHEILVVVSAWDSII
jgi:hypothetical protein